MHRNLLTYLYKILIYSHFYGIYLEKECITDAKMRLIPCLKKWYCLYNTSSIGMMSSSYHLFSSISLMSLIVYIVYHWCDSTSASSTCIFESKVIHGYQVIIKVCGIRRLVGDDVKDRFVHDFLMPMLLVCSCGTMFNIKKGSLLAKWAWSYTGSS